MKSCPSCITTHMTKWNKIIRNHWIFCSDFKIGHYIFRPFIYYVRFKFIWNLQNGLGTSAYFTWRGATLSGQVQAEGHSWSLEGCGEECFTWVKQDRTSWGEETSEEAPAEEAPTKKRKAESLKVNLRNILSGCYLSSCLVSGRVRLHHSGDLHCDDVVHTRVQEPLHHLCWHGCLHWPDHSWDQWCIYQWKHTC